MKGKISILEGGACVERADIERSTVLVPDVSLMQRGDLLVKYLSNGGVDVGIVVGFAGSSSPSNVGFGQDPMSFINNDVIVLSVQKGFQMASLGYWGNPSGGFGGFATDPKDFQIRRIVLSKATSKSSLGNQSSPDSWELVKRLYPRVYPYPFYVNNGSSTLLKAPIISNLPKHNVFVQYGTGASYTRAEAYDFILKQRYFERLPPTSYIDRPARSIFPSGMVITSPDGWRDSQLFPKHATTGPYFVDYHRGIDVAPESTGAISIYAPESGKIWFHNANINALTSAIVWKHGKVNRELSDTYGYATYGTIGVLATDPGKPDGRIYLFAHQGPISKLQTTFEADYGRPLPTSESDAQYVNAGKWIGYMGNVGGENTGAHVHIEVYEYFPDDTVTQHNDPDGGQIGHFDRVNPLSIFRPADYRVGTDDTQILLDTGRQTQSGVVTWTASQKNTYFVKWNGSGSPAK